MARGADRDPWHWTGTDVSKILLLVGLLALSAVSLYVFYVFLAVCAVLAGLALRQHVRRRRRERANADAPYWVDELK